MRFLASLPSQPNKKRHCLFFPIRTYLHFSPRKMVMFCLYKLISTYSESASETLTLWCSSTLSDCKCFAAEISSYVLFLFENFAEIFGRGHLKSRRYNWLIWHQIHNFHHYLFEPNSQYSQRIDILIMNIANIWKT